MGNQNIPLVPKFHLRATNKQTFANPTNKLFQTQSSQKEHTNAEDSLDELNQRPHGAVPHDPALVFMADRQVEQRGRRVLLPESAPRPQQVYEPHNGPRLRPNLQLALLQDREAEQGRCRVFLGLLGAPLKHLDQPGDGT